MKTMEYEELLSYIMPLDLSTLTRLESDLPKLIQEKRGEASGDRRSILGLGEKAWESLREIDPETHWAEREKELEDSRSSWDAREHELARERRS